MSISYDQFLNRLSRYRRFLDMTQEETGIVLGITQSQFSKMELGKTVVPYQSLARLMKAGWDIDYLMTGRESSRKDTELSCMLRQRAGKDRQEFLRITAWLLEQGGRKSTPEISAETRCEMEVLKMRANGEEADSVLHEVRKITGISQIPMSEKLGVNIKKYRMMEKRKAEPDAELLIRIYEVTGCRPSLLIDLENVETGIINGLWREIKSPVRQDILTLSREMLGFLET